MGGTSDATLLIAIKARDEATATLEKVKGSMGGFVGGVVAGVAVLAAVVIGAGGYALTMAAQYQTSLARIQASAGLTAAQTKQLGAAFLSTGGQVTFSAKAMADAYAPVAGQLTLINGRALTSAQSLAVMRSAMDLAEATGTGLTNSTADLAKVMQTFQIPVAGAAAASNVLFNISKDTGTGVDSLTQSMSRARAMMGASAPDLQTMGGLMLDLTQHGETGRGAISALGSAFTGIISPSKAVTKAQEEMGVSFKNAKTGALDPMTQIFAELQPKLAGMSAAQADATLKTLGFGAASQKLAETIQAGPAALAKDIAAVSAQGSAHKAAETATATFGGALDKLRGFVEDTAVSFGQKLLPILTTVITFITTTVLPNLISFAQTVLPPIINGIKTVGTVLYDIAKTVIPPVLAVLKFLADHIQIVVAALVIFTARWMIIKGIGLVSTVAEFAAAFLAFSGEAGVGAATKAVLGFGGPGGALEKMLPGMSNLKGILGKGGATTALEGMAPAAATATTAVAGTETALVGVGDAAGTAGIGMAGLATGGIAILGIAALGLATNVGGVRDSLKNMLIGAGNVGSLDDGLKSAGQSAAILGSNLQHDVTGNVQDLSKSFGDATTGMLSWTSSTKQAQTYQDAWNKSGTDGRAIMTELTQTGQWNTLNAVMSYSATQGVGIGTALKHAADMGDQAAKQMIASQGSAAAAAVKANQAAFAAMQQASAQSYANQTTNAISSWQLIENTYGAGSKQAAAYLANNLSPEQQTMVNQVGTIAKQMGISVDQVIAFGQQGILSYRGVTGTLSQVLAGVNALDTAQAQATYNANILAGAWRGISAAAGDAAHQAAAAAAGLSARGVAGGATHSASGRFVTGRSNVLTWTGEDEDEWIIPRSKAGPYAGLLDAMLGRGSAGAPGAAATSGAPSGGGATSTTVQLVVDGRILGRVVMAAQGKEANLQGYNAGNR